ncbi:MAG: hypothetical protein WAP17_05265 [Bacteroidales bacterium]|jgi:opacity protein-like surface antigen
MKKYIFLSILILISLNSFSQIITKEEAYQKSISNLYVQKNHNKSDTGNHSYFGINLGINNSNFYSFSDYHDEYYYMPYINYDFSLFYIENTNKNTFLGFELENQNISIKSYTLYFTVSTYDEQHIKYNLNFMNFYPLFGIYLVNDDRVKISLNISPYVGFLVYSKAVGIVKESDWKQVVDTAGNIINIPIIETYNINDSPVKDKSNFNFGFRLGYNIMIDLNKNWTMFLVNNYSMGLVNMIDESKLYNMTFQLGISYKFNNNFYKK